MKYQRNPTLSWNENEARRLEAERARRLKWEPLDNLAVAILPYIIAGILIAAVVFGGFGLGPIDYTTY